MACDPGWLPAQPYADDTDLLCDECEGVDLTDPTWEWAITYASRRVFEATGGKYPGCMTSRIRPCRRPCSNGEWATINAELRYNHLPPALPYLVSDGPAPVFANCWACQCGLDPCTCTRRDVLVLPYRPVQDVSVVVIDGDPFTDWSLMGARLYRTDGEKWPTCNADLPDTETGTWSVTFTHGLALPDDARPLVAAYACQLAKRACKAPCDLPDGVRVISRPGVEYAVIDTMYRDQLLTGYQPLDDWIVHDIGGLLRSRERPRMWTASRHRCRPGHRLESRNVEPVVIEPPPEEGVLVDLIASAALSGHRVITADDDGEAMYASNDAPDDRTGPFFLTTGAVSSGAMFTPLAHGEILEPGWSWTPGAAIFLGTNGMLTETAPSSPAAFFLLRVGTALTATTLYFDPHPPITLEP